MSFYNKKKKSKIEKEIYFDLPNAFWKRKQHVVDLLYEDSFNEKQISTKARHIQMNAELEQHCRKRNLEFQSKIEKEIYFDLPNVFWKRKQHVVDLLYEDSFNEKQISTKARHIQMNVELEQHCHIEIKDLESKGFIQKSRSPWSCATFNVNKNSEIKRGTPRLFINYKLLNKALKWIRYPIPNKKDLLQKLNFAFIFSKFHMMSGF